MRSVIEKRTSLFWNGKGWCLCSMLIDFTATSCSLRSPRIASGVTLFLYCEKHENISCQYCFTKSEHCSLQA